MLYELTTNFTCVMIRYGRLVQIPDRSVTSRFISIGVPPSEQQFDLGPQQSVRGTEWVYVCGILRCKPSIVYCNDSPKLTPNPSPNGPNECTQNVKVPTVQNLIKSSHRFAALRFLLSILFELCIPELAAFFKTSFFGGGGEESEINDDSHNL